MIVRSFGPSRNCVANIPVKFDYMRSANAYGYIGFLAKSFSFSLLAAGVARNSES